MQKNKNQKNQLNTKIRIKNKFQRLLNSDLLVILTESIQLKIDGYKYLFCFILHDSCRLNQIKLKKNLFHNKIFNL